MTKRLTRTVFVEGVAYGPSSVIPAAVAAKITNPKVWTSGGAETAPVPGVVGDGPSGAAPAAPAAGADLPVPDAEATVKELRDYAKAKGVTLGAAKTKPEILKVLGLGGDEPAPAVGEELATVAPASGTGVPVADSPADVDEHAEGAPDGDAAGDSE